MRPISIPTAPANTICTDQVPPSSRCPHSFGAVRNMAVNAIRSSAFNVGAWFK
jgi:hypothetical protein